MAESILWVQKRLFQLRLVLEHVTDVLERQHSEKVKFRWKRVLQQTFENSCKINTEHNWKLLTSPKALGLASCCETMWYATIGLYQPNLIKALF